MVLRSACISGPPSKLGTPSVAGSPWIPLGFLSGPSSPGVSVPVATWLHSRSPQAATPISVCPACSLPSPAAYSATAFLPRLPSSLFIPWWLFAGCPVTRSAPLLWFQLLCRPCRRCRFLAGAGSPLLYDLLACTPDPDFILATYGLGLLVVIFFAASREWPASVLLYPLRTCPRDCIPYSSLWLRHVSPARAYALPLSRLGFRWGSVAIAVPRILAFGFCRLLLFGLVLFTFSAVRLASFVLLFPWLFP